MIATTNLPGSNYFDYFHGTKSECEAWLEAKKTDYQTQCGGLWASAWLPARVTPDKEAFRWKYRDGSSVIEYRKREWPGEENPRAQAFGSLVADDQEA